MRMFHHGITKLAAIFAGESLPAIIVTMLLSVGLGVLIAYLYRKKKPEFRREPYILSVQCGNRTAEISATQYVRNKVEHQVLKSKSVSPGGIELQMEVRLKDNNTEFVNELSTITGVTGVTMVLK